MPTTEERKALNEGRFREANERLEQGARELVGADDGSLVPFLCECPDPQCMQAVVLTLAEYEQVRSRGEQGLAAIGHDDPTIEQVVARSDRFLTTFKVARAGEVHRETEPRSD